MQKEPREQPLEGHIWGILGETPEPELIEHPLELFPRVPSCHSRCPIVEFSCDLEQRRAVPTSKHLLTRLRPPGFGSQFFCRKVNSRRGVDVLFKYRS